MDEIQKSEEKQFSHSQILLLLIFWYILFLTHCCKCTPHHFRFRPHTYICTLFLSFNKSVTPMLLIHVWKCLMCTYFLSHGYNLNKHYQIIECLFLFFFLQMTLMVLYALELQAGFIFLKADLKEEYINWRFMDVPLL